MPQQVALLLQGFRYFADTAHARQLPLPSAQLGWFYLCFLSVIQTVHNQHKKGQKFKIF